MVDLETIMALASMTYIVDLYAYELYMGMKKSSMTLSIKDSYIIHMIVVHYYYSIIEYLYTCGNNYI